MTSSATLDLTGLVPLTGLVRSESRAPVRVEWAGLIRSLTVGITTPSLSARAKGTGMNPRTFRAMRCCLGGAEHFVDVRGRPPLPHVLDINHRPV